MNTNGIVYLKAYVDLRQAAEEDFSWLSLYSYLVGKMDSAGHSYAELSNLLDTTGISGIYHITQVFLGFPIPM